MAGSKIKHRAPFVDAEALAMGATAESIATGRGSAIPTGAGTIWVKVPAGDSIHWHPTGTPTSTFGHAVAAQNWFSLTHSQQGAKIISDDAGDVTLQIIYMRGAGRQDNAYALPSPL